jgi:hypothetical protein
MAQMLNLNCSCGYNKEVTIGEGLMALNTDRIRDIFTHTELEDFEEALDEGSCSYGYGSRIAFCEACDDIVTAIVLRYSNVLSDGSFTEENLVIKPCPDCDNEVTLLEEPYDCPKCKKILSLTTAGYCD